MFVIIPVIALGFCVCMYCAYYTWTAAKEYNAQAESYIRMANERLYEADKIWQKMRQSNDNKFANNKGAKILPFKRHLQAVPSSPKDPNNAA